MFGGDAGIGRAVRECGVNAVVVINNGGVGTDDKRRVGEYLKAEGALDVFAVRISVGPAAGTLTFRSYRPLWVNAECIEVAALQRRIGGDGSARRRIQDLVPRPFDPLK